jgi:hypothetical protein
MSPGISTIHRGTARVRPTSELTLTDAPVHLQESGFPLIRL